MSIIKAILIISGIVSLIFAAIPAIGYGILNAGVAALALFAAACFTQTFLLCKGGRRQAPWEIFSGKGLFSRFICRLLGTVLSVSLLAELVLSAVMITATLNTPTYSTPATAVVLGCSIKADKPSLMLQNRLEKALLYLNEIPSAKVVVTGGLGQKKSYSEAEIEAKWLIEKGIAPERIIQENRSKDTYGNIQYAAELLQQNGLPMEAVLFTDGFHQLRSQLYAHMHGIGATGVSSATPWGLLPAYWVREQMAICRAVLISRGAAAPAPQ